MVQLNMVLSLVLIITMKRAIWNTVYPMKNYLPMKNIYYIKCGYNLYVINTCRYIVLITTNVNCLVY